MDKATIAGLNATLLHYLRGEALDKVPVWRMIAMAIRDIERRGDRWARAVGPTATVIDGRSMVAACQSRRSCSPFRARPGPDGGRTPPAHGRPGGRGSHRGRRLAPRPANCPAGRG
jgi:hypothetical protein